MTLPRLHPRQNAIAAVLGVTPPFTNPAMLAAEALRRQVFIEDTLQASGLTTLVLGISGGVDSLVAGRLAQLAVQALRTRTRDGRYRFIAVRLPYGTQHDEDAARAALAFVRADEECTVPIENAVQALAAHLPKLSTLPARRRDVVLGNVKARTRMVAQYALANATGGLVIGTDHAAEAVMGFFTKFGDGACDLAPLSGLVKGQVHTVLRPARRTQAGVSTTLSHQIASMISLKRQRSIPMCSVQTTALLRLILNFKFKVMYFYNPLCNTFFSSLSPSRVYSTALYAPFLYANVSLSS